MKTISCACTFCEEFANPPNTTNRILWEDQGFVLLPSLGALTPGYLLLLPKHHVRSFADLSHHELLLSLQIVEHARAAISHEFGPVILAEHGPGTSGERTSACCDHAHWHLIPCNPSSVSTAYEQVGGRPTILSDITQLAAWSKKSYLFLSPLKHVYWVWHQSDAFTSQFVRQVCARILDIEDLYDWALFPFEENMILTRQRLTSPLQRTMAPLINSAVN